MKSLPCTPSFGQPPKKSSELYTNPPELYTNSISQASDLVVVILEGKEDRKLICLKYLWQGFYIQRIIYEDSKYIVPSKFFEDTKLSVVIKIGMR